MIPSSVPLELRNLTQIEEMLIARALPIMRVYIKPGGQRGYSGHCINLPQNVTELATSLPRYPKDLAVIVVKVKGKDNTFDDETDDDIVSDNNCDVGPPTDNPSEDVVYNESTEMNSFLPVGEQQQQELEAVRNQLSENQLMEWPSINNEPLNEYQISHLGYNGFSYFISRW